MKILIFFLICFFISLFIGCTAKTVTPAYKLGTYKLAQKYINSTVLGSINFYSQNQFYTTIATGRHNYVYSKISGSQIKADCTDCNASYVFTVSNITAISETWTARINTTFLEWQLSK